MADIIVKNKDEWTSQLKRNIGNRNADIDVGANSFVDILTSSLGEALAVLSLNDRTISRKVPLALLDEAETELQYGGRIPRQIENGSLGYVTISTAANGATILVGDELLEPDGKHRYVVTISEPTVFLNGQQVPVRSLDPGSGVNVAAGKILTWSALRAGCYSSATVYEMPNGDGISGGRDIESLDEWKLRISASLANPAGHGNEQDVMQLAENASGMIRADGSFLPGHGVPVAKAFVYPALMGPGTVGVAILIKKDHWSGYREPTSQQLTTVYSYITALGNLPADYAVLPIDSDWYTVKVDISVSLDQRSARWADVVPWPPRFSWTYGRYVVDPGPPLTSTEFVIKIDDDDYSGSIAPAVGKTIGVLNSENGKVYRKRILTVSGTGPWTVTIDTTANQSDTSFVPEAYRCVFPWCDAAQEITDSVGNHIARMGLGELRENNPGDGVGQMRSPAPTPEIYPTSVNSRVAFDVQRNVPSVTSAEFIEAGYYSTVPVIQPDVALYFRLSEIGIFP